MAAIRRLLVGLDLSDTTGDLVDSLPALRRWGVEEVTLVHVASESPVPLLHHSDSTRGAGGHLAEAGAWLEPHFQVRLCLRAGDPGACLAEEAEARDVDGVVLGVRDRGALPGFFLGSTVAGVARSTGRPILLFPLPAMEARRERPLLTPGTARILHPTELSDEGRGLLERVTELAVENGLPVTLLHVVEEGGSGGYDSESGLLAEMAGELREAGVPEVTARVEEGRPWERILAHVDQDPHTLVVMGTHGRRSLPALLLGSQSREVARRIRLPLLLVPERALPLRRPTTPGKLSSAEQPPSAE